MAPVPTPLSIVPKANISGGKACGKPELQVSMLIINLNINTSAFNLPLMLLHPAEA